MKRLYRAATVTWTTGSTEPVRLNFLPKKGPAGGRLILEQLYIEARLNYTTDGSSSMTIRDLASSVRNVRILDGLGEVVNLRGVDLCAVNQFEKGTMTPAEPAAVAASATNAARNYMHVIHLVPPNAKRRWDFGIPVDELSLIELGMPANSDLQGTGSPTVGTSGGTYRIVAVCREEHDVQLKSRLEWRRTSNPSATDIHVPVNGGLLRSLFIYTPAAGATGGTDQSATTTIDIPAFGYSAIERDFFERGFMEDRVIDEASTTNLFVVDGRAIICVYPRKDQKIPEMFRHMGDLLIRLGGNTTTNSTSVFSVVTGRNERSAAGTLGLAGGGAKVSIKTAGKTSRDPKQWGDAAMFLPAKLS